MAKEDAASRIIDAGAEISGGLVGAGIGLLLAGPPGALAGGGVGPTVAAGLKEAARRGLSRREEVRIGGAARCAWELITERLDAGDTFRDDGFFDTANPGQSSAGEIYEGTLLAAQRSYEERKVPFVGYLMANIAFERNVDRRSANWLIKTAQELTWTQLVLLSIVGQRDNLSLPDVQVGNHGRSWCSWGVHAELLNLAYGQRELILSEQRRAPDRKLPVPNLNAPGHGFNLREHVLTAGGQLCYSMMSLDRIGSSEVEDVMNDLAPPAESE